MCDFIMKNLKKFLVFSVMLFSMAKEIFASSTPFPSSAPIPIRRAELDYKDQDQDGCPSQFELNLGTFESSSGSWVNPPGVVKSNRFSLLDSICVNPRVVVKLGQFKPPMGSWVDSDQEDGSDIHSLKSNAGSDTDSLESNVGRDEGILPCGRFERSLFKTNTSPKLESDYVNPKDSWTNPSLIKKSDKRPVPLAPVRLFTQDDMLLIVEKIKESRLLEVEKHELTEDFDVIHKRQVVTFLLGRLKRDCKDYEVVEIFKKFEEKKEPIQFFVEAIARYINLHSK